MLKCFYFTELLNIFFRMRRHYVSLFLLIFQQVVVIAAMAVILIILLIFNIWCCWYFRRKLHSQVIKTKVNESEIEILRKYVDELKSKGRVESEKTFNDVLPNPLEIIPQEAVRNTSISSKMLNNLKSIEEGLEISEIGNVTLRTRQKQRVAEYRSSNGRPSLQVTVSCTSSHSTNWRTRSPPRELNFPPFHRKRRRKLW